MNETPESTIRDGDLPRRWLGLLRGGPRATRLEAAVIEAEVLIATIRQRSSHQNGRSSGLAEHCMNILDQARAAQRGNAYALAYECLKRIRREQVRVMSDDERRVEFAMAISESGSKLNAWRTEAARSMAALVDEGDAPSVEVLQGLLKNLDESQQNRQHKIELIQEQISLISILLVLAVVTIAALALSGALDWIMAAASLPSLSKTLPGALACGLLGGLLSVAFGTIKADLAASIQDIRSSWVLTFARPFIGAAVAVPITLFLQSGFVNADKITPAVLLGFCFIGGFSERWFLSQVDRIGAAAK